MDLNLDSNDLTSLDLGMWNGLSPMFKTLSLNSNRISKIEPGTFNKLTTLSVLKLHNNNLVTLEWNVFGWEKFGSSVHPSKFDYLYFIYEYQGRRYILI